jgi:two-component system phosphate regulon sensor histidine kinase PhoR
MLLNPRLLAFLLAISTAIFTTAFLSFVPEANGNILFISFVACLVISGVLIYFVLDYLVFQEINKMYDTINRLKMKDFGVSRKKLQKDNNPLRKLNDELFVYVSKKEQEVTELKRLEKYRREFLANVSHELKTPLFTIQGYLLTLLDGAMEDKNIRTKYLERAEKGVERLIYIVKDLDMITKLEVGEINLDVTRFNIVEVIQNVFDLFEMKAANKNITLTFDMKYAKPIWVMADQEKIQQVVTNLVVNSIKYGKKGGTTEVGIEDLTKNKVIVRITDNGEGIEKQNIPRLFERFYRVDKSGARSEGGSGLGLAIVKHIIEGHDEKIYVESQIGVGSEFSFTLEKTK